jgi:hypothetical protein
LQPDLLYAEDACICHFDGNGAFLWATYFGGSACSTSSWSETYFYDISETSYGIVTLVGTSSCDFPSIDSSMVNPWNFDENALMIQMECLYGTAVAGHLFGGNQGDDRYYYVESDGQGGYWISGQTELPNAGTSGAFNTIGPGYIVRRFDSNNINVCSGCH